MWENGETREKRLKKREGRLHVRNGRKGVKKKEGERKRRKVSREEVWKQGRKG